MARFELFHNKQDIQHYSKGDVIFSQGEPGEFLYDIVGGEITLFRDDSELVTFAEGEIFGEVALINNTNHSVTAKAASDCSLVLINKRRFLFMVDQTPNFAIAVMRVLAERLAAETLKNH